MIASHPTWQIKMLYDGQCPVCSREVALLRRRNSRGLMAFEDITAPTFNPTNYGLTMPQVIGAMHVVRSDGAILRGVEGFAALYEAAGWNWLAKVLRWRPTRPLMDLGYRLFAAIRPKLSRFKLGSCANGSCATATVRSA